MITYSLMLLLVIMLAFTCLWNVKYNCERLHFFDVSDTNALRGVFCIVVVLVHVPANYQNIVQDMIGSFAYVGVTYYFMVSAYGLKYSCAKKEKYLQLFWIKRIPKLLVPVFLINFVFIFSEALKGNNILNLKSIFHINDWVAVLLLFYLTFWLVYSIPHGNSRLGWCWQDIIICIFVVMSSLIDKLTAIKITQIWPTECMGFMWGIILYNCIDKLKRYMNRNWKKKIMVSLILSAIVGVAYLKYKDIYFWGDYGLKTVLGMIILLFVLCLMVRLNIANKINQFLGSISYEIYLIHAYIYAIIATIFGNMLDSGMFIWLAFIVTIILALLVNHFSKIICRGIELIIQGRME